MNVPQNQLESVRTIDCQYLADKVAAAYLVNEGDRALFVENNTAHSVPILLAALRDAKIRPENVDYLIVTHVHLDHAGGTSALLKHCPNATVLAHPRAARHLIDPSRLIASARQVYGDACFDRLYGRVDPIEAVRVRSPVDGEVIRWGERDLLFIYTRGHANHHFCIFDSKSRGIFTGDSFGLAYPVLQGSELFLMPTTSPTDFDPSEATMSIEKIRASGATQAFLTHFGSIPLNEGVFAELSTHLKFSEALFEECIERVGTDAELRDYCKMRLDLYYRSVLQQKRVSLPAVLPEFLEQDLDLNAAGIVYSALKRRSSI